MGRDVIREGDITISGKELHGIFLDRYNLPSLALLMEFVK